jgi:hypothetical protein
MHIYHLETAAKHKQNGLTSSCNWFDGINADEGLVAETFEGRK